MMSRLRPFAEWAAWELSAARLRRRADRELERIARGGKPIVAGPWLSEVGVELLFWIPMLNWFRERYGIERERITAISRGGADPWYAEIAGGYVDVLDHFSSEELKGWSAERVRSGGSQKQRAVGAEDRAILERASDRIGSGYALLHPSHMHRLFTSFWRWRTGENRLSTVLSRARFRPLPAPAPSPAVSALPDGYVALKVYFNNSFPDTPENRGFVEGLLSSLTGVSDVVLLDPGFQPDEHVGFGAESRPRLHTVPMTERDNLDVQTQVIAGARALFATVGGFSYLAAFLGTPSFSFNSDDERFVPTHRDLIGRARRQLAAEGHETGFVYMPVRAAAELAELVL